MAISLHDLAQALQQREESVRNGKLTTIIFIRDQNAKGQEISGYIDYGHRQVAPAVGAPAPPHAHNTLGKANLHEISFVISFLCLMWALL